MFVFNPRTHIDASKSIKCTILKNKEVKIKATNMLIGRLRSVAYLFEALMENGQPTLPCRKCQTAVLINLFFVVFVFVYPNSSSARSLRYFKYTKIPSV